jgi:hypothetical protein
MKNNTPNNEFFSIEIEKNDIEPDIEIILPNKQTILIQYRDYDSDGVLLI